METAKCLARIARTVIRIAVCRMQGRYYRAATGLRRAVWDVLDALWEARQDILATIVVASALIGWIVFLQVLADSRTNWKETTVDQIDLGAGVYVEVIHIDPKGENHVQVSDETGTGTASGEGGL